MLQGRRERLMGLSLEGLLEEFTAQGMAKLHDQFFQIGEGGPPRRPLGAIEVMEKVFGGSLQDRTQLGRNLDFCGGVLHDEVLS
jgi:hypothetical protein